MGIENLSTFTTFLLFLVMFVMALAVIILVIWVARLAARLRNFSDSVFSGKGLEGWRPTNTSSMQAIHSNTGPVGSGAIYGASQGLSGQTPPIQSGRQMQPSASGTMMTKRQSPSSSGRITPKNATKRSYSSGLPAEAIANDGVGNDFFERYKQHENPNTSGSFGRKKPSIPFGEDRTIVRKRDTYAETAADLDLDPDSIDFSRVVGYRDIYQ